MADLNRKVEVAVVDEIQMIGEGTRGGAWTRAVLGVLIRLKELTHCKRHSS